MSIGEAAPAVAVSFFDAARGLHGTIRSGLTLVFDGRETRSEPAAAEIEPAGEGWRARAGAIDVSFTPTTQQAELGGVGVAVGTVEGTVNGTPIDGLGTAAETRRPPQWNELESLRAISAVFAPDRAVLAIARKPPSASGHGDELVTAALIEGGEVRVPEDTRISTVYDGGGRQHSAGLELWLPGDDFPRRLFGTVQAGTTLDLGGLLVQAAAFTWRMDGNAGAGLYEMTTRGTKEPVAA